MFIDKSQCTKINNFNTSIYVDIINNTLSLFKKTASGSAETDVYSFE